MNWLRILACVTLLYSCAELEPSAPASEAVLDGPVSGLSPDQALIHARGDAAFTNQVFTSLTGLGPVFVATSCGSCHAGDGKGHPFTTLTRFGQTDSTGNHFLNKGGPQLQNRAIPGFIPEQIPTGATSARFTPPANTGLGFLELISDADILSMADPLDADGDGISGVPNYNTIPDFVIPLANAIPKGGKYICRFGKKGAVYSLLQQTVNAYNQDIGIASAFVPTDVYSGLVIEPELSAQTIHDVVFYLQTLKAPIQRDQNDKTVLHGGEVFQSIGCGGCHRQNLTTSSGSIDVLSNTLISPYTDLLLHDMGPDLDDGYTEGNAKTYEWRTAPLWGLGLAPNSQGGQYYLLHDGRATSIEQAIEMHGGEATNSVSKFEGLTQSDRESLIRFLKSL